MTEPKLDEWWWVMDWSAADPELTAARYVGGNRGWLTTRGWTTTASPRCRIPMPDELEAVRAALQVVWDEHDDAGWADPRWVGPSEKALAAYAVLYGMLGYAKGGTDG